MNTITSESGIILFALNAILLTYLALQRDRRDSLLFRKTLLLQVIFALISLSIALKYRDLISFNSVKFLLTPALLYCLMDAKEKSFKALLPYVALPFIPFLFMEVYAYTSETHAVTPLWNLENYDLLWTSLLLLQLWAAWSFLKQRISLFAPYSPLNIHLMLYALVIVLTLIFMAASWLSEVTSGVLFDLSLLGFISVMTFNSVKVSVKAKVLVSAEQALPVKYERSSIEQGAHNQQVRLLRNYMDRTAAYKQHDLKLTDLANGLNLSTHHISQVLNSIMDKTFYEFINEYRIKEARLMLMSEKYDHLSIEGIAMEAGFKNKNSFNTYFKRLNQMTANEFRKRYRN